MNIHLDKYGQGMPLVLFHGWGFDSQIWQPIIPCLKPKYQIILVDLPGFGLTPMMDWESFKKNLLNQLPDKFALAGWSMGGLYATRLAIEEPARVQYLINITSSPRFISDINWPGVAEEVFVNFYNNLSKDINKTLKEFISLQLNKMKFDFKIGNPPSPEGLAFGLEILGTWDFREQLKQISIPTVYLFGRLDPITPVKTMTIMEKNYPNFKYVLFNRAAHMPFLSHTDLFITMMDEFIK
ncbi:TPA: alpha/beta fold hydrolase [Legionella pneumophila]|uniref:alpha/beta fold hydrolase n=1 Tax=Legionella pneumophila TaxID=446 RepID=UPI000484BA14|nr:alpha/beta fold hydrolase [Legionella pneumophila]AMQ27760.1 pimelyl-ACP methyl ester esterase [Legionella pneumophila subsp. pneumophila]MBN5927422.1 alpha/beta fold hydrolase [Legionella pneumophila]MCZ4737178.1 alpha/beta fold hydrolase [Legionella pneumophila]MCZ4745775.1 alpha/beta fold hydrolase [Legionella pneumophila]MDI9826658.1 alpha/beta fold hydrolase [Legionella pneumophila]